ncbi:MAG: hypothetical protein FWG19_02585 [Methanomassiliicoccaceae archaeon]|nr:hypothetical protein [Methanomassiliicoccaceae archaeon]
MSAIPTETEHRRPNAETIAAIEEARAMIRGEIPKNVVTIEELFSGLDEDEEVADRN